MMTMLIAQEQPSVVSHATFEKVDGKSIIRVFIENGTKEEVKLYVGTSGATRDGDFNTIDLSTFEDMKRLRYGIGSPAIPRFVIGGIEFEAPKPASSSMAFHSMKPTVIRLSPGESVEYYRFLVPVEWISAQFIKGSIDFPLRDHSGVISIPINHLSEAKIKKETEQAAPRNRQEPVR